MNNILTVPEIKSIVVNEAKKFRDIKEVLLFGSYAHNLATSKSDVDLIINFEEDFDDESFWGLLESLERIFNKEIHLLTLEGIENSVHKYTILKSAITLYIRDK